MTGFAQLPVELLLLIVSCLAKRDLCQLSLTVKPFRAVAERLLYRDVTWIRETSSTYPLLPLLLRTIGRRPDLAGLVENVSLHQKHECVMIPLTSRYGPRLTSDEHAAIMDTIEVAGLSSPRERLEDFEKGDVTVLVALLVSRCRNLISLRVGWRMFRPSSHLCSVFDQALFASPRSTLPRYDRLQNIDLGSDVGYGYYKHFAHEFTAEIHHTRQLLLLLYLPALRSINVWASEPYCLTWPCGVPASRTLVSLVLNRCQLQPRNLGQLLSATPSLKTLTCGFWCDAWSPATSSFPGSRFLDCGTLGHALDQIKLTIEELTLHVSFFNSDGYESDAGGSLETGDAWGIRGNIGNLKGYKRLQTLTIPLIILLGWQSRTEIQLADILPKGLRELELTNDLSSFYEYEWLEEESVARIGRYITEGAPDAPFLKSIAVEFNDMPPNCFWTKENEEMIKSSCENANITCHLIRPSD